MKAEKLYDCDRVAVERATYYVNNNPHLFERFTKQEKEDIIDDIKNMMVGLAVIYENN